MVILHVADMLDVGGINSVVRALAAGHAARSHQVHVSWINVVGQTDALPRQLEGAGVSPHPLCVPPRRYWHERAAVMELCRRIRPRVVHTHGYRSDVIDGLSVRRLAVPIISTVHGFTNGGLRGHLYEWLHRTALRRFDCVVAVSSPISKRLRESGVAPERVELLVNAWAGDAPLLPRAMARHQLGLSDDELVIGWVGRLSREKGADLLLNALTQLADLPVCGVFIGDGPERPALVRASAALGRRVIWHGAVPNAARLFSAFDTFALSSRTEGTPIVLFEAMAARVPVVATAVGGVPDVVSSAEAVLVPSHDVEQLTRALRDVLTNRPAALRRAEAAWNRLHAQFRADTWLERHEELYDRVSRASTGVPRR